MFKPGQTVKCIESDGTPLTTGDLYTIAKVFSSVSTGAELCWVKETRGDWYADRFEPINIELSQQHNGETHMSSGGPYIASSVYSELKQQYQKAVDNLLSTQLELERVRAAYANRHKELTDMQTRIKELEEELECLATQHVNVLTHPPEQLFPADLAPGTYVAMDKDGDWYSFVEEPKINERLGLWVPKNGGGPSVCNCLADKTPYMKAYNRQSWTSSLHIIGKK